VDQLLVVAATARIVPLRRSTVRGIFAGLVVAFIIVVIALFVATLGALGVAAIGWLLHRWFDLTQWQGSLVALVVALAVGFMASRMAVFGAPTAEPEWLEWDDDEDNEGAGAEPPIVPWRRQRPTQGDLPAERTQQKPQKGPRRK
jgi:hypothetical protein